MQYSSTLVFSWPLKRMPTPCSQHFLVEMRAARVERQAVGAAGLGSLPWARALAAPCRCPSTRVNSTNGGWPRCHHLARPPKSRAISSSGGLLHAPLSLSCSPASCSPRLAARPAGADPARRAAAAPARPGRADDPATAAQASPRRPDTEGKKDAEVGRQRPPRPGPRRADRHPPRHLDEPRRLARRARDRVRPAGRHLCHADRGRRGARDLPPAMPGTCSRATRPTGRRSPSPPTAAAATISGRCAATARNPRQITKEDFRLLNQADWTPDGNFIVARKHFTSARSLGAGEMWLYHRTGSAKGGGVQMTKARTKQKDTNEPAFSPDGRYLYFSDDATPGDTFQYSKDVNGQIYVIQRLDRQTGEIETYVDGPGGAIRPTPSPDGKSLAFIRRVRYKSTLMLMDLAVRPHHPADRHPRPRHAGDLGGPRRLSGDQLDARQQVDRLLGQGRHPPRRRRLAARSAKSRSTSPAPASSRMPCAQQHEVAPASFKTQDGALRPEEPGRLAHRL